MLGQVVRRELADGWIATENFSDEQQNRASVSDEPIATHESGAALYVDQLTDSDSPQWAISITQPIEYRGIRANPVTIRESFRNKQYVAKFIRNVCNGIDDESNVIEAVAFVPHTGSVSNVDLSYLSADDIQIELLPELVDIFCVYPTSLPGSITVEDIEESNESLCKMVYGLYDDDDIPDTITELSNTNEAYGDARLEIFTLPAGELEAIID